MARFLAITHKPRSPRFAAMTKSYRQFWALTHDISDGGNSEGLPLGAEAAGGAINVNGLERLLNSCARDSRLDSTAIVVRLGKARQRTGENKTRGQDDGAQRTSSNPILWTPGRQVRRGIQYPVVAKAWARLEMGAISAAAMGVNPAATASTFASVSGESMPTTAVDSGSDSA